MTEIAVKEAKNTFTQLVREVEQGEPVKILRRGNAVAVLSSINYFEKESENSDFKISFEKWCKKADGILSNNDVEKIFHYDRRAEPERKTENPRFDEISSVSKLWENAK